MSGADSTIVGACALLLCSGACAQQLYIINEGGESGIWALSDDGTVGVGYARSAPAGPVTGIRWTPFGGVDSLGTSDSAFGVSGDGRTIVGEGPVEPFMWRASDGLTRLGQADDQSSRSTASAASYDGGVIVGTSGRSAFRWTPQTGMEQLPSPFDTYGAAFANAISHDARIIAGQVIGDQGADNGGFAATWTEAEGWERLVLFPGAYFSGATVVAMSADGEHLVGATPSINGRREAFLWTSPGPAISLGDLVPRGQYDSQAADVTDDGRIVVGASGVRVDGLDAGFIWDREHGMRLAQDALRDDFKIPLTTLTVGAVRAVSGDGRTFTGVGRVQGVPYTITWIITLNKYASPDANGDGRVDERDLERYLVFYGASDPRADLDGDGMICTSDFFLFLRCIGK